MLESLGNGIHAPVRGPSAEGITLYGGLTSHLVNGTLPDLVDEGIELLRGDTASDSAASDPGE